MPYANLKIRKEYMRNYYKTHKDKFDELRKKSRYKYYSQVKELKIRGKCKPCADCGIQYNPWVMDFDHRNPKDKKFGIGNAIFYKVSLEQIKEEILKCDVVCSNCHRERTHRDNLYQGD